MKNFVVNVSTKTSKIYLEETSVAVDGENIAGQVIFKFNDDEFIDGIARLEWQNGSNKYFQLMEKVGKTYVLPIKNVMTKEGKMYFQLVITQEQIGEEIPVFKSNQFYVYVEKSINAEGEPPSGYDTWLDYANAKLIEMDNLNITASKSGNTETITLTDKQGVEHKTYIYDGQDGQDGKDGADGKDAEINGYNTLEIVAGDNITIDQEGSTLTINGEASGGGNVDDVTVNGTSVVENKVAEVIVPTKVSDLSNDSGFITNTVNNLTNYYLKSETYTKSEVNTLIGNIETVQLEVVQILPSTGEANVIYLVPKTGSTGDVYNEYLYINNNWELIGSTEVDLSNYYTKTEVNTLLSGKQDIVQYSTLPTASSTNVGQIVQYIGNTTSTYTNGYFYKCESDGESTPTYSWARINVQETQSGDERLLTATVDTNINFINYSGTQLSYSSYPELLVLYNKIIQYNSSGTAFNAVIRLGTENNFRTLYFNYIMYGDTLRFVGRKNYYFDYLEITLNSNNGFAILASTAYIGNNNNPGEYNSYISVENTNAYTPTSDYHPATKKYVDDAVATAGANIFEGNVSVWNTLTPTQKAAYDIAIVDNNVQLSQTDVNNINGIMATSGDVESDMTEGQAEDITDEIIGGE